ncbi:MAG: membrane-bound O-acyltransferase family protein [Candidatus Cloacimonetes bacterium HGW-Cloacimonetes-1]|jgi:D-alanyl-lipoteichoic acid acyltransferase DltB (MBOAT superfamily)|nr:MAG: membrane-bound O-acyltransferase family protein [Candidatus Cloacimonetes bacterium HGW-Cloacimonetes-1]
MQQYLQWFGNIIQYNPQAPLLFNSVFFLFFFALILLFYPLIANRIRVRTWYLMLFSVYFYYKTSGLFIILLVLTSLINYWIGAMIYRSPRKSHKNLLMLISVLWNLGSLAYFKYTNFILDTINQISGGSLPMMDIILPVGISFFTFQTMSYSLDVYYGKLKPLDSFIDFTFFVSFFPQLVAGPIVRASYFIPQINKKLSLDQDTVAKALVLIFAGLIKKGVVADYISVNFVERVFESPGLFSGVENLIAVYAYGLQIYCDFSGYSDIAIGLAALMGFSLPLNFNAPYTASSITDFWRRWHISLSTWLRDYLYIPLGGNRRGKARQILNLMLTMLLGGLWHGASWNFVFWGGLHGIGLAFDKFWLSLKIAETRFMKVISTIITFHFVCFCWIFFRARTFDSAWLIINRIFTEFKAPLLWQWIDKYRIVAILIGVTYLFHWLPQKWSQKIELGVRRLPLVLQSTVLAFVVWILFQARSADIQPFIYFQF